MEAKGVRFFFFLDKIETGRSVQIRKKKNLPEKKNLRFLNVLLFVGRSVEKSRSEKKKNRPPEKKKPKFFDFFQYSPLQCPLGFPFKKQYNFDTIFQKQVKIKVKN